MLIDLLVAIILSGIFGMLGQSIRVLAGLKKLAETNLAFSWNILIVSLIIGFVSGDLAFLGTSTLSTFDFNLHYILGLMAAGYAGTDFIEAFMKKNNLL